MSLEGEDLRAWSGAVCLRRVRRRCRASRFRNRAPEVERLGLGVLDIGRESVDAQTGKDLVVALRGRFRHNVREVVDHIGIVAFAADQRVAPFAAVQRVIASSAR